MERARKETELQILDHKIHCPIPSMPIYRSLAKIAAPLGALAEASCIPLRLLIYEIAVPTEAQHAGSMVIFPADEGGAKVTYLYLYGCGRDMVCVVRKNNLLPTNKSPFLFSQPPHKLLDKSSRTLGHPTNSYN